MKTITLISALFASTICASAATVFPDTTIIYRDKKVIISDKDKEMKVSVYQINNDSTDIMYEKTYEGIFSDSTSVERQYDNNFSISIPNIFLPKEKRRIKNTHWDGFGIGFSNFSGDFEPVINVSRSLQYNLNLIEAQYNVVSNLEFVTGMGIQFNSMHFQKNTAIEVQGYKSVITTTSPGQEYLNSRLHYTYLTFPFLLETSIPLGRHNFIFLNAGAVVKVKTASSSKVWVMDESNRKRMIKLAGDLNIRPITYDLIAQAGINDFGFFASYSPMSLFLTDKGPKVNQFTFGLQLHF